MLLASIVPKGWTTQQVDYTNTFAHADINEEIYVEYPKLFESISGEDHVLRLKAFMDCINLLKPFMRNCW